MIGDSLSYPIVCHIHGLVCHIHGLVCHIHGLVYCIPFSSALYVAPLLINSTLDVRRSRKKMYCPVCSGLYMKKAPKADWRFRCKFGPVNEQLTNHRLCSTNFTIYALPIYAPISGLCDDWHNSLTRANS